VPFPIVFNQKAKIGRQRQRFNATGEQSKMGRANGPAQKPIFFGRVGPKN